jgi:hypothetical protein
MKIDIEQSVTVKVVLTFKDIQSLMDGNYVHSMMDGQVDEKPMYVCISRESEE